MNRARLEKLQAEKREGFLSPKPDGRGKHNTRPRKISDDIVKKAEDYVLEVVKTRGSRSHFNRGKHAKGTIFLPHTLSIRHLHRGFLKEHDPEFIEQLVRFEEFILQAPPPRKPIVTLEWFRETLFNQKFGKVKFRLPKTDECGTCLTLRTKIDMEKKRDPNNPAIPFVRSAPVVYVLPFSLVSRHFDVHRLLRNFKSMN